ncbi:sulfite exporter TauE/SafE family protein [Geomesophilobacter sediminis]|uniref:Sulfite exporter TauE/SafE family protein n=1 Tax=Geomesophilobacter sediminis TaxID=2798584 RepID=A0A8J7LY55_9BACT|nr:sulfite exporter TauE/SafE family protein [Geomesophilobacter sediminis]MBJ6724117.1 sulfite exporter TauE/SafE family protein [Geomesophilobacter sediminis]
MVEIMLAFSAGLAGGFHCIGMCGGIVAALSLSDPSRSFKARAFAQLSYNLGRITTYTGLGILCAYVGSALDLARIRSASTWIFGGANVLVMTVGLSSLFGWSVLNLSSLEGHGVRVLAKPLGRLLKSASPATAFPLGLVMGFLPCGLVYAPLIVATVSGSPLYGGAVMAALGAGTLPILFLFGTASGALSSRLRQGMFRLAGLAVFLMGASGLWRLIARSCPNCNL